MTSGMRKGLTSYGDKDFSLFLRKAFIKGMGYSDEALDRPIVGITNTYSDFNPCHTPSRWLRVRTYSSASSSWPTGRTALTR